jgi:hypothetical protein
MDLRPYYPPELRDPPVTHEVSAHLAIDDGLERDEEPGERRRVADALDASRGTLLSLFASDAQGMPSEFAEGYAALR